MRNTIKTNKDLHIQRKLFHFISVFCIFLCTVYLPPWMCWLIYILFAPLAIMTDVIRQSSQQFNRSVIKIMGPILRKTEIRNLSGATFAVVGVGLAYLLFPPPASQLAILFLAVGDPIASYFGILKGKHKLLGKKSWEGFLAAAVFCFASALLFFVLSPWQIPQTSTLIVHSLVCGVIGAVAELIPIAKVDDNLSQPFLSGALLSLFFTLSGVLQSW